MLFFKLFSLSLISFFQAAVFVEVQPLIVSVMDGYNVCLFCYGQTGSGKTWTMVSFFYFISFLSFHFVRCFTDLHNRKEWRGTEELTSEHWANSSEPLKLDLSPTSILFLFPFWRSTTRTCEICSALSRVKSISSVYYHLFYVLLFIFIFIFILFYFILFYLLFFDLGRLDIRTGSNGVVVPELSSHKVCEGAESGAQRRRGEELE